MYCNGISGKDFKIFFKCSTSLQNNVKKDSILFKHGENAMPSINSNTNNIIIKRKLPEGAQPPKNVITFFENSKIFSDVFV